MVRRPHRRLLGLALALALGCGALAGAATAGATEVGVNVAATSGDYFHSAKVLAAIRASKPAWVRVFVGWNGIEPARGTYNTAEIESYRHFFAAIPAGTKIDIDVVGTPPWAAGGSTDVRTPPANAADYAGFVNYLANAFGGRVAAWEIWNEEDSTAWWTGTAGQYVALLKAAYAAIKAVEPKATVIIGGLTGNDGAYLSQLYGAGAKGSFDGVGVHTDTGCNITSPYVFEFDRGTQTINQYFFLGFISIHGAMVAAGDADTPIYMTELGWSSTTAACQTGAWAGKKLAGVSDQTQATYLTQAYHCLAQPEYGYVKAAMWFELFDNGNSSSPLDNFGLLRHDFSPKPAFAAFTAESRHGDQLSGSCGDLRPPAIQILTPTSGHRYRGALHIAIRASDPTSGVHEITIRLGRNSRVHFISEHSPATFSRSMLWQHAKHLRAGRHTIHIEVTDKYGNMAKAAISFVHLAGAPPRHRRGQRHR